MDVAIRCEIRVSEQGAGCVPKANPSAALPGAEPLTVSGGAASSHSPYTHTRSSVLLHRDDALGGRRGKSATGFPRIKPFLGVGLFLTQMRSSAQLDFVPAKEDVVGARGIDCWGKHRS